MHRFLLTTAIASFAASDALAGNVAPAPMDPTPMAAPAPSAPSFDGFYAGVLGGTSFSGQFIFIPGSPFAASFPLSVTTYGGMAGYNHQMGNVVLGAEIDAQRGSGTVGPVGYTANYVVDVRARLGYAMGSFLVYGAGGLSMDKKTITGTSVYSNGFNVGVGAEVNLTDNVFIGGEYTYRRLNGTVVVPISARTHSIQARIGMRF
jgi:outer membrane immunogenic protein